ncbi:transglutaminase domain-containing protein [candidate division KSB1 bacterium]|nr:transglutaminase domain-containing protein [candidate division KSB1 bacterium]
MKKSFFILVFTYLAYPAIAENYLINGGQESQINYQMEQKIEPAAGTKSLYLSFVEPTSFGSSTYNQYIKSFNLEFSKKPYSQKKSVDKHGNKIVRAEWKNPAQPITIKISITAINKTKLDPIKTSADFPLVNIPSDVTQYLSSTKQVPSNDREIINKAKQLTMGADSEFDAVQMILSWVVDHVNYTLVPQSYDAMYSLNTGIGNCQNFSHLSAALLRAVGIPTRIVNGVTLKEPYDINIGRGIITTSMAQGRHSWIEVFFSDLGWVPLDPQQTALYVSNRFIRVEVGLDNNDTQNDGLVRWTQSRGYRDRPRFEEKIEASFAEDRVNLLAEKQWWGPQKLMFYPQVESPYKRIAPPAFASAVQESITAAELGNLDYHLPITLGNLDFPENVSFLSPRGPATKNKAGEMEMRKNFLVETAEYVTTKGNQYAQTFILTKPVKLKQVGLALHNFGGDGQLWIELFKDDGEGKPGEYIATSEYLPVKNIPFSPGYAWVDFDFSKFSTALSPGRYWIALGFTGSPVINWFYTYGKPVGPIGGTRYKTLFDETWSRCLTFEFNYRIEGETAK